MYNGLMWRCSSKCCFYRPFAGIKQPTVITRVTSRFISQSQLGSLPFAGRVVSAISDILVCHSLSQFRRSPLVVALSCQFRSSVQVRVCFGLLRFNPSLSLSHSVCLHFLWQYDLLFLRTTVSLSFTHTYTPHVRSAPRPHIAFHRNTGLTGRHRPPGHLTSMVVGI